MLIELKLCLESAALAALSARDLAQLAEGVELPQAGDSVRVAVELADGQTDPAHYLTSGAHSDRRALVIVSPKLAEPTTDGCKASALAQHILETSWQRQIVVGLIGVTELSGDRAIGLDAVIAPEQIKHDLRAEFHRLVHRLWFKLAPPQVNRLARRKQPRLEALRVQDKASFRECLALRHRVYSALGYLEVDVAESQIRLDLDCYDTRAKHFVVMDRTADRVAATARLPLAAMEDAHIVMFRQKNDRQDHFAVISGDIEADSAPLVRLHSQCVTGDILGSLKCDCGPQLSTAIKQLNDAPSGILLYLAQEGRDIGLLNKIRAYALQDKGLDTVDANHHLGFETDERFFGPAASMLRALNISKIKLLTNNPDKVAQLEAHNITITKRISLWTPENPHNHCYIDTKKTRTGHLKDDLS